VVTTILTSQFRLLECWSVPDNCEYTAKSWPFFCSAINYWWISTSTRAKKFMIGTLFITNIINSDSFHFGRSLVETKALIITVVTDRWKWDGIASSGKKPWKYDFMGKVQARTTQHNSRVIYDCHKSQPGIHCTESR
jgi:hypothetical protein